MNEEQSVYYTNKPTIISGVWINVTYYVGFMYNIDRFLLAFVVMYNAIFNIEYIPGQGFLEIRQATTNLL